MDDQLLLFLVLFPLLSVAGIVLVVIGLSGIRKARLQAEREQSRAAGTVVDIVRHLSLGRGKPLTAWHPVVEFEAEGQTIRQESREGYPSGLFTVGENVGILYDAEDPGRFHLEKMTEKNAAVHRVTVLAGILWIVLAGIVAFLESR